MPPFKIPRHRSPSTARSKKWWESRTYARLVMGAGRPCAAWDPRPMPSRTISTFFCWLRDMLFSDWSVRRAIPDCRSPKASATPKPNCMCPLRHTNLDCPLYLQRPVKGDIKGERTAIWRRRDIDATRCGRGLCVLCGRGD